MESFTERLTSQEIERLRNLAYKVKEIANNSKWEGKVKDWTALNDLKPNRPMVLMMPECWQELMPESEIKDPFFKNVEENLARRVFREEHFNDDMVLDDILYVPYVTVMTDWVDHRERPYDDRPDHSGAFHPCIIETSDFEKKMHEPTLYVDREKTEENFKLCQEIFGDILTVVKGEPLTGATDNTIMGNGLSMIDVWVELRGLEQVMMDLYMEPEFTHEVMSFMSDYCLKYTKQCIDEGIWLLNNNNATALKWPNTATGSNGLTYTTDLPAKDYDGKVRSKDLWLWLMAQEFTCVSPEMLAEFILPYQAKIAKEFGLIGYGCCEVMDKKYDVITEAIPNIRQFSINCFSDIDIAAKKLGGRYAMNWKVNPTNVFLTYDENRIENEIRHALEVTQGMPVIAELREVQTMNGHMERATWWINKAMELVYKYC